MITSTTVPDGFKGRCLWYNWERYT